MFRIHALPAGNGDALLLEFGTTGEKHHVLIDGGRSTTSAALIQHLKQYAPVLDLVVVTHVDLDHICGIIDLLAPGCPINVKEIWFNGFVHLTPKPKDHLAEPDLLGPVEGEQLSSLIVKRNILWNERFGRDSIVVPDGNTKLPEKDVAGLKLTVLAPTWKALGDLQDVWEDLVVGEGLVPGESGPRLDGDDGVPDLLGEEDDLEALADRVSPKKMTPANRSSIALLAEYGGRRCLLAGDADPEIVVRSLKCLSAAPYDVHLFKLPHHGSHTNVTKDLISQVRCKKYLFTTNGTGYKNPHPHKEAVARTIVYGGTNPTLLFNYDCATTKHWKYQAENDAHPFAVTYGIHGLLSESV